MDASSSAERDPVEILAEEFAARRRRGESPSLAEYQALHPELADRIRTLFPALGLLADFRACSVAGPDPADPGAPVADLPHLGDYRLIRQIGRGGMGVVYEAEQVSLGRLVAVKVLPQDITGDPRRLRRFEREARAAARLHHTNIVPVLGMGHHDGTHFYIMQLIHGQGLDRVVEELSRLRARSRAAEEATVAIAPLNADRFAPTLSHSLPEGPADPPTTALATEAAASQIARSLVLGPSELAATEAMGSREEDPRAGTPGSSEVSGSPDPAGSVTPGGVVESPASSGGGSGAVLPLSDSTTPSNPDLPYWDSVARIGLQVAEGLAYAHGQGIVHRDIKPSNLLLDLKGTVWITDFGLARSGDADELSQSRDLLGTIRYMPPERFEGHTGDARSDIYSLGLTLYELLALRPAYQAANQRQLIRQVSEEAPTPLRKLDATIPRALEAIVHKAIAREPGRRYAGAGELAADLRRFLERRPIRARPAPWPERFALWCRRNPALAALTVLAAALTIAIAAISTGAAVSLKVQRDAARKAADDLTVERSRLRAERQKALDAGHAARAERDRADRMLYTSNMRLAQRLYESEEGTTRAIADLLDQHIPGRPGAPDLRDFTWRLQWTRLHRAADTFLTPTTSRYGVLTADGQLLTLDRRAQLGRWDPKAGRGRATVDFGRPWAARCFALAPDGRHVARGETLGATLHLFDAATGREVWAVEGPVPLQNVEFSPDGRFTVSLWDDRKVRVHEVDTGKEFGSVRMQARPHRCLALAPGGRTVLLGNHPSNGAVTAYDIGTGEPSPLDLANTTTVHAVACAPDGRRIAVGNGMGRVIVWDTETRTTLEDRRGHSSSVLRLAFSADGLRLASGDAGGQIVIREVGTKRPLTRLKGHTAAIVFLAFAPDASALASGDADARTKVWDLKAPDGAHLLNEGGGSVVDLAFTPDGRGLVTAGQADCLWDVRTRSRVRDFDAPDERGRPRSWPERNSSIALSRDGTRLATGDTGSRTLVQDVATGRVLHEFEGVAADFYAATPDRFALSTPALKRVVRALAFSPDDTLLVAGFGAPSAILGNYPQAIKVWDLRNGGLVARLPVGNTVPWVRFSPEGAILYAACHDGTVRSWDVATWKPARPPLQAGAVITSAALSPDARHLAAGLADGRIILWESASGREVGHAEGHSGAVVGLAFSPDGRTLASGGRIDQNLVLWHVPSLLELYRERTTRPFRGLAFSPGGDLLASAHPAGAQLRPALSFAEIDAEQRREAAQARLRDEARKQVPNALPVPKSPPAVTPGRLDAYLGRYRIDPAPVLDVTRQGNQLVVTPLNAGPLLVVPESEDHFVHPASGVRFRFEVDAAGQFATLVVSQDGRTFEAHRLPQQAPAPTSPP